MRINVPIESLIGFLIIGLVAGFLAEMISRNSHHRNEYLIEKMLGENSEI